MAQSITAHMTETEFLYTFINWRTEQGHWPLVVELKREKSLPTPLACADRFGGVEPTRRAAKILLDELTDRERAEIARCRPLVLSRLQEAANLIAPQRVTRNSLRRVSTPPRTVPTMRELALYCGGLDAALRMLDLPVSKPTKDDLVKVLIRATDLLGETPTQNDCRSEFVPYSANVFQRAFGTWNNALIAAGLELNLDQPNRRQTMLQKRAHLQAREQARKVPQPLLQVQSPRLQTA